MGDNILFQAVNYGENITLPCHSENFGSSDEEKASISEDGWLSHRDAMWVRQGREDEQITRMSVQHDGSLSLSNLDHDDSGVYLCVVEDEIRMKVKLEVRGKLGVLLLFSYLQFMVCKLSPFIYFCPYFSSSASSCQCDNYSIHSSGSSLVGSYRHRRLSNLTFFCSLSFEGPSSFN